MREFLEVITIFLVLSGFCVVALFAWFATIEVQNRLYTEKEESKVQKIITDTEQDNNVICTIDTLEFVSYHQEDRFNHFWGTDKDTVFVHGCVVVLEDGAILSQQRREK